MAGYLCGPGTEQAGGGLASVAAVLAHAIGHRSKAVTLVRQCDHGAAHDPIQRACYAANCF